MDYSQEEFIEQINNRHKGTLLDALNIRVVEAEKDRVVATMPIGPHHLQPVGYLHGGASVVLAESLASLGSLLNIDRDKQMAFGMEINANHVRPKREGTLTGVATPIARGRTTHVWDIRITDEKDKLVCISRCTVAIVDRPPDNP